MAAKKKHYVAEEGEYLAVEQYRPHAFYIAWFLPEEDEFGAFLGESGKDHPSTPPVSQDLWEEWVAERAVAPFSEGRDNRGYLFENERAAKKALAAANEALLRGRVAPTFEAFAREAGWKPPRGVVRKAPDWAVEAWSLGWVAPKGWKP